MIYPIRQQFFSRAYLVAFAVIAFLSTPLQLFAAGNGQPPATIQVVGSGTAAIAPDIAIITMGVLRQAKTARGALNSNNQAMSGIISALKGQKIADKDMQTSNFNIQPRYQYFERSSNGEQKPPRIIGYQVSNQLTIRIRDLKLVGTILDMAVTRGINDGGNIRFANDDPSEALAIARTKAMKSAIEKATTLVEAAGLKLGRILNINERASTPRPQPLTRRRARSAEASVPVQAGENSYDVEVNVSWEIEQ